MTNSYVISNRAGTITCMILLGGNYYSTILNIRILSNRNWALISYEIKRNNMTIPPLTTALYQTEEPEAILTSPITAALGATNALEFMAGSLL